MFFRKGELGPEFDGSGLPAEENAGDFGRTFGLSGA
jgi:hypothetical protein